MQFNSVISSLKGFNASRFVLYNCINATVSWNEERQLEVNYKTV